MQRTYAKKAACTNNTKLLAADNTAHEGVLKYHFYTNIFFMALRPNCGSQAFFLLLVRHFFTLVRKKYLCIQFYKF